MEAERAISYHRTALLRLLTGLFALIGLAPDGDVPSRLPSFLRNMVLRDLLPAESATRRLVFFLAKRMHFVPALDGRKHARKRARGKTNARQEPKDRVPVFWLFDRRKFFTELSNGQRIPRGPGPAIRFFDERGRTSRPEPVSQNVQDAMREAARARRVCRRMQALLRALEDMPAQARRLLRVMERRKAAPPGPGRYGPLRPGAPPGFRDVPAREVDELLSECDLMARTRWPPPDD